jgi:hypothetical protein
MKMTRRIGKENRRNPFGGTCGTMNQMGPPIQVTHRIIIDYLSNKENNRDMIELALTILFFISIFAIIRSGRGDKSKKEKGDKKRDLTTWIETMKKYSGSDDYYY